VQVLNRREGGEETHQLSGERYLNLIGVRHAWGVFFFLVPKKERLDSASIWEQPA
jgi:hypothetical protein